MASGGTIDLEGECQPARAEAMVALLRHDRGGPCSGGLMDNRVKVT
jgi:hypothetical protein